MSSVEEIKITTSFLNSRNAEFVLLHCNSTYPAPFHDINLNWIKKLEGIHPLIGYSGHERGIAVTLAAHEDVALAASRQRVRRRVRRILKRLSRVVPVWLWRMGLDSGRDDSCRGDDTEDGGQPHTEAAYRRRHLLVPHSSGAPKLSHMYSG